MGVALELQADFSSNQLESLRKPYFGGSFCCFDNEFTELLIEFA